MRCKTCVSAGEVISEDIFGLVVFTVCPDCKGTGEVADESQAYGTDCRGGTCE